MYLKPKKRLGQNFLIDKNIQNKIIHACNFRSSDTVLEIGAGRGELTGLIAKQVNKVYAFEIDRGLCCILKDNLINHKNVAIINKDFLKFDLREYFKKSDHNIKVIGNIPYYITTPIIEYLLKYKHNLEIIFLTVQKEFALRMLSKAGNKDYGSFSCFIQYYTRPKKLFFVTRTCFKPAPKVDSCFLQLEIRQEPPVKIENEELFFKIIRAAFNKRRKTLRNSLKGVISLEGLEKFFAKYDLDSDIRPESLTLEDFAKLSKI